MAWLETLLEGSACQERQLPEQPEQRGKGGYDYRGQAETHVDEAVHFYLCDQMTEAGA